jgi:hypothetical protein
MAIMALSSRGGRAERTIQVLSQTSPRHCLSEKAESCYEWIFGRRRSDAAAMGRGASGLKKRDSKLSRSQHVDIPQSGRIKGDYIVDTTDR